MRVAVLLLINGDGTRNGCKCTTVTNTDDSEPNDDFRFVNTTNDIQCTVLDLYYRQQGNFPSRPVKKNNNKTQTETNEGYRAVNYVAFASS